MRYTVTAAKAPHVWVVRIGRKTVGRIKRVELADRFSKGYQYRPTGSAVAGEVFPTLQACERSLTNQ